MVHDAAPGQATAQRIAQRFRDLLATRVSPRGKRYTLREISEGTGGQVTIPWLGLLKQGGIEVPGYDKLEALARFFRVKPSYFTGANDDEFLDEPPEVSDQMRRALAVPGVSSLALKASEMGPEERALVLTLLERSREAAALLRAGRSNDHGETGDDAEEEE